VRFLLSFPLGFYFLQTTPNTTVNSKEIYQCVGKERHL
jgi:hypothetical protein